MVCSCLRTARTSVGLSCCRFHLTFELNELLCDRNRRKIWTWLLGSTKRLVCVYLNQQFCARVFVLWSCVAILKK